MNTETKHMTICPACGSEKWKDVHRIGPWTIEECAHCRFSKIDPLPSDASRPELYTESQVVTRNTKTPTPAKKISRAMKSVSNRILKRDKTKIFRKKIERHVPPGGRVFDIGCGDGTFLDSVKENYAVAGNEISDYLAQEARRKGIEIHQGDFQQIGLPEEKYDAITMISLIEHLDDPFGTLKKCYDHLKDGGVLFLKTPNYSCLNKWFLKDKWPGFRPPDHITHFSPSNLKQILKKIGFRKFSFSAWPFNDNMYCDAWK